MASKWIKWSLISVGLLSLIALGIFFFSSDVREFTSEYFGPDKTDFLSSAGEDGGSNKVTLKPIIPNPLAESFNVYSDEGTLKIDYQDLNVTYDVSLRLKNKKSLTWAQIPKNIKKDLWVQKITSVKYKHGITLSGVNDTQKLDFDNVVYEMTTKNKITNNQILTNAKKEIKLLDKITLSHKDLLRTYTIPKINKSHIIVGGLNNTWTHCITENCTVNETRGNWVSNGDGTWNITFDPEITLDAPSYNSFADFVNVTPEGNFSHLSTGSITDGVINETNALVYMPFDIAPPSGGITTFDWTNHSHDGVLKASGGGAAIPIFTDGYLDNGYVFDGIIVDLATVDGSYIEIDDTPALSSLTEFTLSAWLNSEDITHTGQPIISKGERAGNKEYRFRMLANTFNCHFSTNGGNEFGVTTGGGMLTVGTWAMMTCTWNSTHVIIYKNGVEQARNAASGTMNDAGVNLVIGAYSDAATVDDFYDGKMDEILILNRSLSAAELNQLHFNQSSRFPETGTQDIANQSAFELNITTGHNRVNVTTNFEPFFNSSMNLTVGYFDGSWSATTAQELTNGTISTFNISSSSTNISLNYTFIVGNSSINRFYSPIMVGDIIYETFAIGVADNPPKFSNNATNSTISGQLINHTLDWTDETGLAGYIFSFDNGTGTFINDTFVPFIGTTNTSAVIKFVNQTVGSTIRWIVYANDSTNQFNVSATYVYTTTSAAVDTTPPTFTFIPADVSIEYLVNMTAVNFTATDETAFGNFSVNDSRFTINNTGTLNVKFDLGVGVYPLNISINDTTGNLNWTLWNFTVTQNTSSCDVLFNETSPIDYLKVFVPFTNCDSTFTLARNGTSISNNSVQQLGGGAYNFSVQRTDVVNYSNIYDEEVFAISKISPGIALAITPSTTENYTVETTATGSGCPAQLSCNLFLNSTAVSNPDVAVLGVNLYNYTFNTTGNVNYTSEQVSDELTITPINPNATITNTEAFTITYPTEVTIALSESNSVDGDVTYVIHRDSISIGTGETITLGVGTFNYTLNTTGGTNFTANASQDSQILTVNQNASDCGVFFNDTGPVTFGNPVRLITNCSSAFTLLLNGTAVSNNSEHLLGGGFWNGSVQRTDDANYSDIVNSILLNISRATGEVNLTLNNSRSNVTIEHNDVIILRCDLLNGDATTVLQLDRESTQINSGTTPISNSTQFSTIGEENITCFQPASQNYTADIETWFVEIVPKNVSLNSFSIEIDDVTTSSTTEVIIFNGTVSLVASEHLTFKGSGGLAGTGGGDVSMNIRLEVNGIDMMNEIVGSVTSATDRKQFTININDTVALAGDNVITVYATTSKNKAITINNLELLGDTDMANNGEEVLHLHNSSSDTFSNTGFVNFGNFTFNKTTFNLSTMVNFRTAITTTGTDASPDCYLENNITGQRTMITTNFISGVGETRNGGAVLIADKTVGPESWGLWCASPTGDAVTVNSTLYFLEMGTENGNIIGSFQNNTEATITAGAGETLLGRFNYTILNDSNIQLTSSIVLSSTTGAQIPTFFMNTSNSSINCNQSYERSVSASNQEGVVKMYLDCGGVSKDIPYEFNLYVDVPAGESLDIFNASFSGFEIESLDIVTGIIPPIVTWTNPENGSILAGIQDFNVTVSDPSELGWRTNITLLNNDLSHNKSILNSTTVENLTGFIFDTTTVADGNYTVEWNASNSAGFGSDYLNITIDNTGPIINVFSPPNGTIFSGPTVFFNATANENIDTWIVNYNGTNVTLSDINTSLQVENGEFNLEIWANDSAGNWGLNDTFEFSVVAIFPLFDNFKETPADPATYAPIQDYEFNATVNFTNGTVGIEFDGVNFSATNFSFNEYNFTISNLAVGTYNYRWFAYGNGTIINFNQTEVFTYTVNQNATNCNVTFNETSPIDFGEGLKVFTDCTSAFTLLQNGSSIANNSELFLGGGTWNFTVQRTDDANYSVIQDTQLFTISPIASEVNLTLNNTRGNVSIVQNEAIDLNCSLLTGDATTIIQMDRESTQINANVSPIGNNTNFTTVQVENITCFYPPTQNYTADTETWFVNVTAAPDVTPPVFTDLRNFTQTVNTSFSETINATDVGGGIDTYSLNDTSVFNVSSIGLIQNVTPLVNVTVYVLNLTVNDTSGNIASGVFNIDVTDISPKIMNWTNIQTGLEVAYIKRSGEWWVAGPVIIGTAALPETLDMYSLNGSLWKCSPSNVGAFGCVAG